MAATLAVGLLATGWVPQFGEGLKKVLKTFLSLLCARFPAGLTGKI